MARRKTPETPADWRQEVSLQLLALVRTRKSLPNAVRVRYFAIRDLAKLHGVELDVEFKAVIEKTIRDQQEKRSLPAPEARPYDPNAPSIAGTTSSELEFDDKVLTHGDDGGNILDELGG